MKDFKVKLLIRGGCLLWLVVLIAYTAKADIILISEEMEIVDKKIEKVKVGTKCLKRDVDTNKCLEEENIYTQVELATIKFKE